MKRNDSILLAVLLLVTGLLFCLQPQPDQTKAAFIEVKADGKLYGTWRLDSPQTVTVTTAYGKNEIRIRDNAAFILHSDCPNQDCTRQSKIVNIGDSIICLPHKLVIEGKAEAGAAAVDAVAR
ncbi:MAG: NusG domain II-containing protein [Acidaminococcaceae bacterium]|nr:NusG domain II-containing protein [Acidaminococcaceae bacterium]MBQ9697463.1 NusG domain II-containing protein [Acidaminococcaceae bacterium]